MFGAAMKTSTLMQLVLVSTLVSIILITPAAGLPVSSIDGSRLQPRAFGSGASTWLPDWIIGRPRSTFGYTSPPATTPQLRYLLNRPALQPPPGEEPVIKPVKLRFPNQQAIKLTGRGWDGPVLRQVKQDVLKTGNTYFVQGDEKNVWSIQRLANGKDVEVKQLDPQLAEQVRSYLYRSKEPSVKVSQYILSKNTAAVQSRVESSLPVWKKLWGGAKSIFGSAGKWTRPV